MPRFYINGVGVFFTLAGLIAAFEAVSIMRNAESSIHQIYGGTICITAVACFVAACTAQGLGKLHQLVRDNAKAQASQLDALAERLQLPVDDISTNIDTVRKIKVVEHQAAKQKG